MITAQHCVLIGSNTLSHSFYDTFTLFLALLLLLLLPLDKRAVRHSISSDAELTAINTNTKFNQTPF
jgi:hypothetical protein